MIDAHRVEVRPFRDHDVAAVHSLADLYHRRVRGHVTGWSEALLRADLQEPGRDPDRDMVMVTVDGRLVASGHVEARAPFSEIELSVALDLGAPDDVLRLARAALLQAFDEAARHHLAGPGPAPGGSAAVVWVDERDPGTAAAVEAAGFRHVRDAIEMACDLVERPPSPPVWPVGVRVETPLGTDRAAQVADVVREAFAEHQGDMQFDRAEVAHWMSDTELLPHASVLVHDADGPVGTVLSFDQADGGYVGLVGVRRRGRGRGLATAMLAHALTTMAADGISVVRLHVERESRTGAVAVYERVGLRRDCTVRAYLRPIADAPAVG